MTSVVRGGLRDEFWRDLVDAISLRHGPPEFETVVRNLSSDAIFAGSGYSPAGPVGRTATWRAARAPWVFHVGDGVFLDSEAAGAALVFAVTPSKILAFTKAPYSQTRYLM